MKDNLVKQGIIVDNEFTKNYEFNDVFHASTIVSTNDISGKKAWSLRDGKTIEALEQTRKNINHFLTFYEKHKVTNLKEKRQKIDKRINELDRKSTRLNSSHVATSYAVFCLKKKNNQSKIS